MEKSDIFKKMRKRISAWIEKVVTWLVFANRQRFTIYEGDWEYYYIARIEVWHKNAISGKETKFTEKNYRVEGWMR